MGYILQPMVHGATSRKVGAEDDVIVCPSGWGMLIKVLP